MNITGKSEPDGVNGAFSAKAALHSWAKGLSREVGPSGITVNSVPPGRIMSEQIERNYTPEYRQWQSANETAPSCSWPSRPACGSPNSPA